jgi:hypothetical protein
MGLSFRRLKAIGASATVSLHEPLSLGESRRHILSPDLAAGGVCNGRPRRHSGHPYDLHALDDLRDARAHLARLRPDERIDEDRQRAIDEIDAAIGETKRASIDDGKDLRNHPPIDAHLRRTDRFHKALELLDKAHKDVRHEEDDPYAKGLQDRALRHIDEAHHTVEHIVHSMA